MSHRPRVATFINSLWAGGAETALLRLITATRDDFDHMVIFLTAGGELVSQFQSAGIAVVEAGLRPWISSPRQLFAINQKLRDFQPHIVTAHMYHASALATAFRFLAAPTATLFWNIHHSLNQLNHDTISTRLGLRLCRLLAAAPTAIIFVSGRSAEEHEIYGFPREKSVVIPNGYDLRQFRPDDGARRSLRAAWEFEDDDVVVGHVSRIHPIKDHGNMIAALALAAAKNVRLRFVFCGAGTESLAIPDSLLPLVRRLGFRSDVAAVMSACDIGCLSSYGEAFPNVLAEFMACERPCVTTDVGDAAVIVGEFGHIVPPRNPEALGDALISLSWKSELERGALGRAARKSVIERFDIDTVSQRHAALWRAAAGKVPA